MSKLTTFGLLVFGLNSAALAGETDFYLATNETICRAYATQDKIPQKELETYLQRCLKNVNRLEKKNSQPKPTPAKKDKPPKGKSAH